ncbi:hypothetical protein SUDANB105_07456 [Streptomyces sp. enrichment culture]|uniref:Rv1733c family protein n=1 Tax=Streptomyces sp. enrichment culture TaxID=1795815 RepID=UPI003F57658A
MSGATPPAQPPPTRSPRHASAHPLALWRRRRNPLRRRSDRLQGWIALGLCVLVPSLGLAATFAVGDAAHRHYRATAEHQMRTRHLTTAVLAQDAPRHPEPGSAEARKTRYPVTVRFTGPDGRTRTAKTDVLPGLTEGSGVDVWVGSEGAITEPPMTDEQIRSRTMGWAILTFLAVALAGAGAYRAAALVLYRRNLAEWANQWAEAAPRWTASP